MKDYKKECLTGIPYRQRLERLQKRYLGAYKAGRYAERLNGANVALTERERVIKEGRY